MSPIRPENRDHCPACRVACEVTEHRDATAHAWSPRRAALNFARVAAQRACPDYQPASAHLDTQENR